MISKISGTHYVLRTSDTTEQSKIVSFLRALRREIETKNRNTISHKEIITRVRTTFLILHVLAHHLATVTAHIL